MIHYATGILLSLLSTLSLLAQGDYVQAVARPGEGVLSLLKLYQCDYECSVDLFYQLNNMSKPQGLVANRTYNLPIKIHTYNGQSIRSTLDISDRNIAEKILSYNEEMLAARLQAQDFRTGKILWVPHHILTCPGKALSPEKQAPSGSESSKPEKPLGIRGIYSIFGKKFSNVPLLSKKLEGKVFYIISGHGGPDPGAIGKRAGKTLCEDEYAYDVSLRLARNLLMHQATVYIVVRDPNDGIRSEIYLPADKDEVVWGDLAIPLNQTERLDQRATIINDLYRKNLKQGVNYQRLVELHIDAQGKSERKDMYFYHRMEDAVSERLANTLLKTIEAKYALYQKGRGYAGSVSSRDLHVLRETLPVAVFIELGNIQNTLDQDRLVLERNRELVAEWLCEGLISETEVK